MNYYDRARSMTDLTGSVAGMVYRKKILHTTKLLKGAEGDWVKILLPQLTGEYPIVMFSVDSFCITLEENLKILFLEPSHILMLSSEYKN